MLILLATMAFATEEVYVSGYTKADGTYVSAYYRTAPNDTVDDNYSTFGNWNPHTLEYGTISLTTIEDYIYFTDISSYSMSDLDIKIDGWTSIESDFSGDDAYYARKAKEKEEKLEESGHTKHTDLMAKHRKQFAKDNP